jgi:uncharacterized membrane protein
VGRTLRANGALRSIGAVGRVVIAKVYPRPVGSPNSTPQPDGDLSGSVTRIVLSRRDGTILAFDAAGLVSLALRHDCVIEIVPRVGDFVAVGTPLFRLLEGGGRLSDRDLRHSIAIGPERTFRQDPAFALRIIVDIAAKALSPAINDPTTAVIALDELHHLLRAIGSRHLDDHAMADAHGKCRLIYQTPNWGDFLSLAVTEIRQYGGESIQVARRLGAMLENLMQTLPEIRRPAVEQELAMLRRSAARSFSDPEDRAMAEVCDPQGVGGRNQSDEAPSKRTMGVPRA